MSRGEGEYFQMLFKQPGYPIGRIGGDGVVLSREGIRLSHLEAGL